MTVTIIRQYITNRFREYDSMASALGPPIKQKYKPKMPRLPSVDITAGAATTEEGDWAGGRGGRVGRGGRNGRGGRQGKNKLPYNVYSPNGNTEGAPPGKKKYEKQAPSCAFCVAKKRPPNPHYMGACPWISAASKSDLITTLPNLSLGGLRLKTVGEHKCPDLYKERGRKRYFCPVCKLNTNLCKAPTNHTQSFILETFVGHSAQLDHEEAGQAAVWS